MHSPVPYFCLYRRAWIPWAIAWDPASGRFTRVEGPDGGGGGVEISAGGVKRCRF